MQLQPRWHVSNLEKDHASQVVRVAQAGAFVAVAFKSGVIVVFRMDSVSFIDRLSAVNLYTLRLVHDVSGELPALCCCHDAFFHVFSLRYILLLSILLSQMCF